MAIRVCWRHYGIPILGRRGGRRGSAMVPLERAMVVSYRLSIVTVALSMTIRPQFAIECLRRSNQQGVGDFWPKCGGVSLAAEPSCCGCKERTSEANWKWNISEEFQPVWSQFTNVTNGQTCDRNTALCTKVHRAVKITVMNNKQKHIQQRWSTDKALELLITIMLSR